MRRRPFPSPFSLLPFSLFLLPFLVSCLPVSPAASLPTPLFFYLRLDDSTLVLTRNPDSATPFKEIPLETPSGCSFWSLTPAPVGPLAAIEWECAFGPTTQILNLSTGKAAFLLDDPTVDNRLLAWNPDGEALYLKAGTLSNPQVLRVDIDSRRASSLPVSPNTYDLSVSPDDTLVYSFSNGIGFGSETWLMDGLGRQQRQILSDAKNILGLMHFSPDGKHIAYIRLPDSQADFLAGELWVMDSDGKNAHLTATADAGRGMPPVWSPDGGKIAFIGREPGGNESTNLSIYDLSTAQLHTLNFSPLAPPVWALDGLYFTRAENDTMAIWFYETASGNARKVLSGVCCAGWIH